MMHQDHLDLHARDFRPRRSLRVQEDVPLDGERNALLRCEVSRDEGTRCAAEVVDVVGHVLTDVNFPVRVRYAVDDTSHQVPPPKSTMNARPRTIQIFLPTGDPRGIQVAALTTSIVQVIEVPRPLLSEFLQMPESRQVGVYYLIGDDEEKYQRAVYVGHALASGSMSTTWTPGESSGTALWSPFRLHIASRRRMRCTWSGAASSRPTRSNAIRYRERRRSPYTGLAGGGLRGNFRHDSHVGYDAGSACL